MKNFFKGFIVGIGKIIPGVSGAMLAISMGIYDKAMYYICNFMNKKRESIIYLFPIGLGIILSIIFFSKIISLSLGYFYLVTMLFFIGLIIGGVPLVINKTNKKDYYITIISFVCFFLLTISNVNNVYVINNSIYDFVIFFFSGIVDAFGTVVPGISSTALLMIIGTYDSVIYSIGNFENIRILIPFCIGILVGIIAVVKIVNYLFSKCEGKVYAFILGVLLSNIIVLVVKAFKCEFSIIELIIGLIFMVSGIFISTFLKEK